MKKIAIVGNIGSGKTTVINYLNEKGYAIIKSDEIARSLTSIDGKALPEIKKYFGSEYIDVSGSMNRKKMADTVFQNKEKKELLEMILTEKIKNIIQERIDDFKKQGKKSVFIEIPLLFEKGNPKDYDYIFYIHSSKDNIIKRVIERDDRNRKDIENILKNQIDYEKNEIFFNEKIENNSSISELKHKIDKILNKYYL